MKYCSDICIKCGGKVDLINSECLTCKEDIEAADYLEQIKEIIES